MEENINNSQKKEELSTVRTLTGDVQKYVKEKNVSLINIFSQKKRKKDEFRAEKRFKITSLIGVLGIVILILTALGLGYKIFKPAVIPQKESPIPKPIILSDEIITINLTDEDFRLSSKIAEILENQYSFNTFIYLAALQNENVLTPEDFFTNLRIFPPASFTKSLEKNFLLGIYADNNRHNNLVIAFKIMSNEWAYRGMLEWENKILEDLAQILPARLEAKKAIFETKTEGFSDKIINNIDARILKTNDGKSLLVYVFFAGKFLIITTSEESLNASIERLKISLSE